MKSKPILLCGLAAALGSLLTGCIVETPGPRGPIASRTVTTYETGRVIRTLPPGYRTEEFGGTRYYRSGGTYYRPHSGGYVVVDLPDRRPRPAVRRDVVITTLPSGYRVVENRRGRYFENRGVYYQRRGNGYVIVDRPY